MMTRLIIIVSMTFMISSFQLVATNDGKEISDTARAISWLSWMIGYGLLEAALTYHKWRVIKSEKIEMISDKEAKRYGEIVCVCGHVNQYKIEKDVVERWLYGWSIEIDSMYQGKSLLDEGMCESCGRVFTVKYGFKVGLTEEDQRETFGSD